MYAQTGVTDEDPVERARLRDGESTGAHIAGLCKRHPTDRVGHKSASALQRISAMVVAKAIVIGLVVYKRAEILG
jgi:hypothetical protein